MPAKGSGAGRVKGAPQLITRVSSDEFTRVEGLLASLGIQQAELVRVALNRMFPELRLSVSQATYDALVRHVPDVP